MVVNLPFYCTNCGAANQPQSTFCFACGQPLQAQGNALPITSVTTGPLAQGHILKERYCIVAEIGKGGMGTVYKAKDTLFNDHFVAVKELSQIGLNTQEVVEATAAFKREAQLLVGLNHPNLPKIQDYFADAGRWYLVMDFIDGETLEEYLAQKTGACLSIDEALDMGIQLCSVLDYLHTRQPPIIFRDLKPANVMRTPDGKLYLIDFGIARHFRPGQAKDTMALGSLGYAAPEQYGKAQTTPRSDIYSLGAVLYELLTGTDPSQALFQLAPLRLHKRPFPDRLDALLMQMLEKDASKRPESVATVKKELQRIATRVSSKQGFKRLNPLTHATIHHRLSWSSKTTRLIGVGLTLLIVCGTVLFTGIQAHQLTTPNTIATTMIHTRANAPTATVNAATPNAIATTLELQNVYNNATHGTPVLDDPLRDNSKGYGWDESTSTNGGACTFKDGAYDVSQSITYYFQSCTANPTFSNFVFEVQMKITKGDGGGIIFRADSYSSGSYIFDVRQDGSYRLFLFTGSQSYQLLRDSSSLAIKTGLNQINLIGVIAVGNTIGLTVNHNLIDSLNDNTYSSGPIGVIAMPQFYPTKVEYSNAKVWSV